MTDFHALADDVHDAALWRTGRARIRSWSVREVSSGIKVASVTLVAGDQFLLVQETGEGTTHSSLSDALSTARSPIRH